MATSLIIFLAGMLVSGFGTIVGFGGGVFMVPILVIVFHIPIQFAVGAVVTGLLPSALLSSYYNARERTIDPVAALWLEIPTIIGAAVGAYLTAIIPVAGLESLFAAFVSFIGVSMLRRHSSETKPNALIVKLNNVGPKLRRHKMAADYEIGLGAASFFGLAAGLLAGVFGVGGGFLKTPIMIRIFKMPPRIAVSTALFMIVFTSSTALISHASLGHIKWDLAIAVASGFVFGAQIGNILKKRMTDLHTEKLIAAGLVLAGVATAINTIMH